MTAADRDRAMWLLGKRDFRNGRRLEQFEFFANRRACRRFSILVYSLPDAAQFALHLFSSLVCAYAEPLRPSAPPR